MARIIGANGRRRLVITVGGVATFTPAVTTPLILAGMRIGGLGGTYGATF